jgi:tRNA(Arg) A34 adenosine deaminase TadA
VIYVEEEDEEDEEEEDGGGGRGTRKTRKTTVIGRGWNHDYFLDPSTLGRKNKIVLHSEVHAVADAIFNYGEDECFERVFPRATIMIVELLSDYAYDTCHPCPKCDPLLRAVGIPTVLHTTPHGRIEELDLRPANAALLSNENVYIPLIAACRERNITCGRLQQKCELVIAKEEDRRQVPARPGRS